MKNKMSTEKKTKLFYSGELLLIAVVAIVIGILKLVGVIETKPTRLLVYNIITIAGGAFLIFDFCWALFSKKRRPNVSFLDKSLAFPPAVYLIVFDIICFVQGSNVNDMLVVYSVGLVLLYLGAIYIFEGIYHWFHLTPQLQKAIEEELKEEETKLDNETSTPQDKEDSGVGD